MDVIEVAPRDAKLEGYAMSIPKKLIIKRLDCDPDDAEAIQTERECFREFLYEVGVKFLSNMDAWEVYNFDLQLLEIVKDINSYAPDDYEEPSWGADIKKVIEEAIRPNNANEYGGQQ